MRAWLKSIVHFVTGWWRPDWVAPPSTGEIPQIEPPQQPEPAAPPASPAVADSDHGSGEFYFRETILDQLDYYMECIARLRRLDVDAFELYSRTGAYLMSRHVLIDNPTMGYSVTPWFRQTLPTFGAVFFGEQARQMEKDEPASLWPRFLYFQKYDRGALPPDVQRTSRDGAIYMITTYWSDWACERWPVLVDETTGRVSLLRNRVDESVPIRHHNGEVTYLRRKVWRYGTATLELLKKSGPQHLCGLFVIAASWFERSASSVIRVSASRGSLTATFSVCMKRTPYFFKDRETTLASDGRRKRIFHIVRPHSRVNGSVVKMHFRGQRSFEWNGYKMLITVPGKHHEHINEFAAGAIDARKMKPKSEVLTMAETGDLLRGHMRGDPWPLQRGAA